jgi:isocitrate lyase
LRRQWRLVFLVAAAKAAVRSHNFNVRANVHEKNLIYSCSHSFNVGTTIQQKNPLGKISCTYVHS